MPLAHATGSACMPALPKFAPLLFRKGKPSTYTAVTGSLEVKQKEKNVAQIQKKLMVNPSPLGNAVLGKHACLQQSTDDSACRCALKICKHGSCVTVLSAGHIWKCAQLLRYKEEGAMHIISREYLATAYQGPEKVYAYRSCRPLSSCLLTAHCLWSRQWPD